MEEAKEMALNIAKAGAVLSECFKGSSLRLQAVA
jgi:hypothetical protein